ncbi:hypothetical protein TEU_03390 [Thermococcus eurythermalis]|uniref:Uncharacterized protein n=1 Tax=Thermococcus eurythermalis TaxID=1505907 RepID=A0A097QSJ1_9EURY|nr:hypothetical protein [Thermococcus eurythermalis]AIU69465.1 hypothetical protein TEU_03390 [Thermococcus eurythermalis]
MVEFKVTDEKALRLGEFLFKADEALNIEKTAQRLNKTYNWEINSIIELLEKLTILYNNIIKLFKWVDVEVVELSVHTNRHPYTIERLVDNENIEREMSYIAKELVIDLFHSLRAEKPLKIEIEQKILKTKFSEKVKKLSDEFVEILLDSILEKKQDNVEEVMKND